MQRPRYALVLDPGRKVSLLVPPDLAARIATVGLVPCPAPSGLRLFIDPVDRAFVLEGRCGLLLGTVFDASNRRIRDPAFLDRIGFAPDELIRNHWGGYLAVDAPPDGAMTFLRDPGGLLPCYHVEWQGLHLVASDIDILHATGFSACAVDWPALARHLCAPGYRTAETAMEGVRELDPGCRRVIACARAFDEPIWSPWPFAARAQQYACREEAAAEIRRVATGVVAAWSSLASHVLVELSGGLDSSIVAASLQVAGARFSCATYATHEWLGDEREQASIVSDHLGRTLHEVMLDVRAIDLGRCEAAHLPRPTARAFEQAVDQALVAIADHVGADMFMHGGGGDNVFCYLQSTAPVIDRLLWEGPGRGVFGTLGDICDLAGCSIWQGAGQAIRRWAAPLRVGRWREDRRFLGPLCKAVKPHPHPWFLSAGDAVPGKLGHVALLLRIRSGIEALGRMRRAPVMAPLLSQPLVEACLRVPSWWWCEGGQNRVIARRAFEKLLPAETLARRSKGTPDAFAVRLFEARREEISAMLLEGELAEEGLLDRPAIAAALRQAGPTIGTDYARLLALVDAEAWVRHQQRRRAVRDCLDPVARPP